MLEGVHIPPGQQQTAMDCLGTGGVIIQDNEFGLHGAPARVFTETSAGQPII